MSELKENEKWDSIRKNLDGNYKDPAPWEDAISLYNDRLRKKFFEPINLIIDKGLKEGEGFTIVTAQCALIESFASFETGKIFNHSYKRSKKITYPSYEYNGSRDLFVDFLKSASIFEGYFWEYIGGKKVEIDDLATKFYSDVRCGLMHEARTKGDWLISTSTKIKDDSGIILKKEGVKIKILRTVLHFSLKEYLKEYFKKLRTTDNDGEILRRFFGRKLDHLFGYSADPNMDWWADR